MGEIGRGMPIHCKPDHRLTQILGNLSKDLRIVVVRNLVDDQQVEWDSLEGWAYRLDDRTSPLSGVTGLKNGQLNPGKQEGWLELPRKFPSRRTLEYAT